MGNLDDSIPDHFRAKGMMDNLEIRSYVPHAEVTKIMSSSDLLLFVIPQSRNNSLIITGKLFEYLASGTPILSIGPVGGDAAQILDDSGRNKMLDYNDKESLKEQLYNYYKQWKSDGSLPGLDVKVIAQYSRQSSAKQMVSIMNNLISKT